MPKTLKEGFFCIFYELIKMTVYFFNVNQYQGV